MKLNKKGFTMVELLAAVSIMAILSGIAVAAYSRYQDKARQDAYKTMEQSAHYAAANYIQDKGVIIPSGTSKTFEVIDLIDAGFLEKLEDPRAKGFYCHNGSTVEVTRTKGSSGTLDEYTYIVKIKCEFYESQRVSCVPNSTSCSKSCSSEANTGTCNNLAKEQKIASCGTGYKMCIESGVKFED